jgi:hypothetical protein
VRATARSSMPTRRKNRRPKRGASTRTRIGSASPTF